MSGISPICHPFFRVSVCAGILKKGRAHDEKKEMQDHAGSTAKFPLRKLYLLKARPNSAVDPASSCIPSFFPHFFLEPARMKSTSPASTSKTRANLRHATVRPATKMHPIGCACRQSILSTLLQPVGGARLVHEHVTEARLCLRETRLHEAPRGQSDVAFESLMELSWITKKKAKNCRHFHSGYRFSAVLVVLPLFWREKTGKRKLPQTWRRIP